MVENAHYLKEKLEEIHYPACLNEFSNTVFFRRPNKTIIDKYDLALDKNEILGDLAHAVVMQHVTKELIDQFVEEIRGN